MASRLEENLCCPICHGIFQEPVVLLCSHSFCKACWQRCWMEKATHECPVCKRKSAFYCPPRNLALKNLCEAFSAERDQRGSEAVCRLHAEKLTLFCRDHQQAVCLVCLHSSSHTDHSFSPVDEAAADCRARLQELLKPLQEKLELFKDIKGNFDQTAKDIDLQAQDAERQITDVVLTLQTFLKKEEQERVAAVTEEKKRKSEMMKKRSEALSREMAALSDAVRAAEDVLGAEDLSVLQRYKAAAERVQRFQPSDPQAIPGGLIDTAGHLNNLYLKMLDGMTAKVTSTLNPPTCGSRANSCLSGGQPVSTPGCQKKASTPETH